MPSNSSTSPLQITSAANFTVLDDQTSVTTVAATDAPGQTPTYSIVPVANGGAADGGLFQINSSTGVLTFVAAPEFESPADSGHHNLYNVTVAVQDQAGYLQQQNLAVTVTPTAETPVAAPPPVFDGQPVQAEYVFGQTPTTPYQGPGALQTGTVGPGVEFANLPNAGPAVGNGVDGLASVDIGSSTILVNFPLDPNVFSGSLNFASASADPYNGVLITFPNGLPTNFAGFTIVNQAGFGTALTASNITVSGNSVFVSVAGNSRLVDSDPNTPGVQPTYVLLKANYTGTAAPVISSNGGGATASVTMSDKTSLVTTVQASETAFAGAMTYAIVPASGGGGGDSGLFEIINGNELRFRNEPDGLSPPTPASPGPYQVTVEASDGQGGFVQQTLSVTLFAETNHPDSKMSALVASPTTLTADGVTTTTLTVTVEDSAGNPLRGQEVALSVNGSNNTFGAIIGVTDTSGTFTTTLASTTAQTETITATENTAQEQIAIVFTAGAPSATNSTLTASAGPVTADGVSTTTLTVTVRDAHGNPVVGQNVTLTGDGASNIFGANGSAGTTDANGVFQTTLASTLARTETITATEGALQEQTSVTFTGGPPSSSTSTLTASAGPVTADGVQTFALTVTLKDASGNPASNQSVTLSGDGSNNAFGIDALATITGTTDANGVFTTTLASTLARTETITATEGGTTETTAVTFTPGAPSAVTSSLVAAPGSVSASGQYATTLTVTVRDANDNLVVGQNVTLAGTGATFGNASGVTDSNGLFTTTVSDHLAPTSSITATINGTVQEILSLSSAGVPSATTSTLTESAASAPADGVSTVTLTVTALDAQGDTLAGQAVTLSGDGTGNSFASASGVTNANGVFTTTLASGVVQGETITATIGGTVQETVPVTFTTPSSQPPTVTTPVITGTAQEGQTLTATGAVAGDPADTVSYQWQLNGQAISGQTASTYVVKEGDETGVITVVATATSPQNLTASATSLATLPVSDAAPTVTTPTITGTAQEGQVLTATGATAGQADNPVTYQWQSSADGGNTWSNISGATGSTYVVQEADEGVLIKVVATATNAQNLTAGATSLATLAVTDAAPTVTTPTIAGTAQEGQTLTATGAVAGDPADTVSYQWQLNGQAISGQTASTYVVQEGDETGVITVVATATSPQNLTASATSLATLPVSDAAPTVTTPTITGTAQEGQVLTATGATAGQADNPVTYQWQSSADGGNTWSNISGASGSTYVVQEADEGVLIEAVATAANGNGVKVSTTSGPTSAALDAAPTIGSVSIIGTAQQGLTLSASATGYRPDDTLSFQWQLNGVDINGAVGSTFLVAPADVGGTIAVVAKATNDNNVAVSATSAPTAVVLGPAPPALSNPGSAASYLLGGPAVAIAPSMALVDSESTTVNLATISISSGFLAGDLLNFTNTSAITGAYNAATGVLTLSGVASVAAYQAALDSITYSSSAKDATGGNTDPSRTLAISVNDGQQASNTLSTSLILTKPAGQTFTLTTGTDTIHGGFGDDTVKVAVGTLGANDSIDTGGGFDTLAIQGMGLFNLGVPKTLANIDVITVNEAQSTTGALAATKTQVVLRNGLNATVNVLPLPGSTPPTSGITITGANDSATINLATGTDIVNLGSANETVNGGAGPDTVNATAATAGALIRGGAGGTMTVNLTANATAGGSFALNPGDSGITALNLNLSTTPYSVNVGGLAGLTITDKSTTADTITGVVASDIINDGSASVLVQASAANAGLRVVGGIGADVLEITDGGTGTVTLNPLTTKVKVKLDAATNLALSAGVTAVTGSAGDDTINATAANIQAATSLDGGGGSNTLVLKGYGTFNLGSAASLANFQTITVFEGQAGTASIPGTNQTIILRSGQAASVNVTSVARNPANPNPASISITGANDSDVINLGNGSDTVTLGSALETVNGGAGPDTVSATAATAGALIRGGAGGTMTVNLTANATAGGSFALNPGDSGITALNLNLSTTPYSVNVGGLAGLTITDKSTTADTITGVVASDIINDGSASVLVQASAANAGLRVVGGIGADVLEITDGGTGTVTLNPLTTKVKVKLDAATNLALSAGVTAVTGSAGDDTINATAANIQAATSLDGGGGSNTLVLKGYGTFNLGSAASLANFQTITVFEGQAGTASIPGTNQTIILRSGQAASVNVTSVARNPANPNPASISITGANDSDVINLGNGSDTVTLGSALETVNGGAGPDTVSATAATAGALIKGGAGGTMTVNVTGGGAINLNAADSAIAMLNLKASTVAYNFTANAEAGLVINDQSTTADTITAGGATGAGQTITGGAAGKLTMIASGAGGTTIKNASTILNGDTIQQFATIANSGNAIDITDFASISNASTFTESADGSQGVLKLVSGTRTASVTLFGQYMSSGASGSAAAAGFSFASDGHGGTNIVHNLAVIGG